MRSLFIISDTFAIAGRGLVVAPAPLISDFPGPKVVEVELRRPDGSTATANLSFEHAFQTPPPREYRWACIFRSLGKGDVPIGTEIWLKES
jgi:hypothetical protein